MEAIMLVMAGIEAAMAAAPKVIAVANKGKELITELFNAGVIAVETQNSLHARVDVVMEAYNNGEVPPALVVEPDPTSPPAAGSDSTSGGGSQ